MSIPSASTSTEPAVQRFVQQHLPADLAAMVCCYAPRGVLVYSQRGLMLYDGAAKWEMLVENKSGEDLSLQSLLVISEGIYINGMNENFAREAKLSSWKFVNCSFTQIYSLLVWKDMFVGSNWPSHEVVLIDKSGQVQKSFGGFEYHCGVVVGDELFCWLNVHKGPTRFVSQNLRSRHFKQCTSPPSLEEYVIAMVAWRREIFMFWNSSGNIRFSSYNIGNDTWEDKNAGNVRDAASAAVFEDKLYVFGGLDWVLTVYCYDLVSEEWSRAVETSFQKGYCKAAALL